MGKLLEELKRRKVFRIAGVYAVVGWVLAQVAAFAVETFAAPQWVQQVFVVFLILGFPLAVILAWAYEITPDGIRADAGTTTQTQIPAAQSQRLMYATFILVLLAVGFQIADRFLFSSENQTATIVSDTAISTSVLDSNLSRRFSINIGNTLPLGGVRTNAEIALSADGSKLVYRVQRPGDVTAQLYLKYLDQLEEQELSNDEGTAPFFSADGEWVGFGQGNDLYKVSIRGGAPQLLAKSTRFGTGGFWSADDTIFYTSRDDSHLRLVSENGGEQKPLSTDADNANSIQSWPYLLPEGDAFIYTVSTSLSVLSGRIDLLVQSTGEVRTIIQNGYNARYAPTGHIVFVRDAALWAVPFDAEQLQITGPERLVVQGVQTESQRGIAVYAFSDDGLLVYLPGGDTSSRNATETALIWVDREGNEEALPQVRNFRRWALSPDGRRLAVSITEDGVRADIWVYDLARNTLSRLTFDESDDYFPLWTPDGERVVFGSNRDGGGLWWRAADGTGVVERVLTASGADNGTRALPYAFTPTGSQMLYTQRGDIYTLTPGDEAPSQLLIQAEFGTFRPDLSPDGRWLAYASNETGRREIYVRPFPNIDDGKWQISSAGGTNPKWSPDGLELFFSRPQNSSDRSVWVAPRETADTSQFDTPVRAFEGSDAVVSDSGTFDISADGSRLLLQRETERTIQATEVTLLVAVDNWFEELKRLAPPDLQ